MFRITGNWIMVPQFIYYILMFGSGLGIILSAIGLYRSARKKKGKKCIVLWGVVLVICLIIETSILIGKVVGHMMVGG